MSHFALKLLAASTVALALVPASASASALAAPPPGPVIGPVPDPKPIPHPVIVPPPTPIIVSVGDSAISGEAGRWAGNTKLLTDPADALGPHAYDDNASGTGELIAGCHRAKSAPVHITADENGNPVQSVNFACSGAHTTTYVEPGSGHVKPGLDFNDGNGHDGQAQLLQDYATAHPHAVKAVVVLIGAGDFEWTDLAKDCAEKWTFTVSVPGVWPLFDDLCQDDPGPQAFASGWNVQDKKWKIRGAILNVRKAMDNAHYGPNDYKIILQTYSSPIPDGPLGFRYPEFPHLRGIVGGCPILDRDATWVNSNALRAMNLAITEAQTALYSDGIIASVLDTQDAFVGRRLCENTVGLLEERGVISWQQADAADKTEWVKQINQLDPNDPSYQENAHPNYWGYMALRNCFRKAYNNGSPHGGKCVRDGNGLNSRGEPNMKLL